MVFFSCDGCGEMLKKNQVDAHANRCRRCDAVSCVDCSVSFYGDDYRAHTSCMTEAERYEGAFAKKNTKKKRNPQEEWMDIVTESISTAPQHLKGYLRTMSGLDNIPRKEKQFRNFTGNSLNLRGRNDAHVGEIWNLLKEERDKRQAQKEAQRQKEQAAKQQQQQQKEASSQVSNDNNNNNNKDDAKDKSNGVKDKKSKEQKSDDKESSSSSSSLDTKRVQKAMKKTLKKAPNKSMKIKELRRQLGDQLGLSKSAKKILKEFLQQAPKDCNRTKVKVDGKIITLI